MKNQTNASCPIARTLSVIGDAWSLLILRDALAGMTRFDQFRKSLGIAPTILTKRLSMLTDEGILQKRLYSEHPPREEYVLTTAGKGFMPILTMIGAWGRKYRSKEDVTLLVDAETGQEIEPIVIDSKTGAPIGTRHLRVVPPQE